MCDILKKFDGVAFVGDESLADVYAGFNILLREDLEAGSLKEWETSREHRHKCSCDSQFTAASCLPLRISSSEEVYDQADKTTQSPYTCPNRESLNPNPRQQPFPETCSGSNETVV